MRRDAQTGLTDRRILIVGNWPPPLGGVSVHVQRLRSVLQARGAFVSVLEPTLSDAGAEESPPIKREPGVWRADDPAGFAARLTALAARSDLIHLHTSGANPRSWLLVHAVGRTAQALSRPCIVTFHSGHLPTYVTTPARAVSARIALAPYRQIVTVSQEIDLHLRRIGAPGDRMCVLPAFGLDGHAAADPDEPYRSYRQQHRPLLLAMLAPGAAYGGAELLEAYREVLRHHPRAGLVLYGHGTDDAAFEATLRELETSPLRLGPVPPPIALGMMRSCDLFVRPTHVDGDSLSVREALAMGARVVATQVGTRPAGVTLCPPADAGALARACIEALDAPPPPTAVFGPDGLERLLTLYEQLLGDVGAHRRASR